MHFACTQACCPPYPAHRMLLPLLQQIDTSRCPAIHIPFWSTCPAGLTPAAHTTNLFRTYSTAHYSLSKRQSSPVGAVHTQGVLALCLHASLLPPLRTECSCPCCNRPIHPDARPSTYNVRALARTSPLLHTQPTCSAPTQPHTARSLSGSHPP